MRRTAAAVLALVAAAAACGDSGADGEPVSVQAPADATFCSVFTGEYRAALGDAVPVTEDGFEASAQRIVAWAGVLDDLAPEEIAALARANLQYHQAQAAKRSAADFIPDSNAMHEWANGNC